MLTKIKLLKMPSKYILLTEYISFLFKQVYIIDFKLFLSEKKTHYLSCDFLCL